MLLERESVHLTEERLIGSRWVFGFKDSKVITGAFYFGADGSIENYNGEYEKTWKIEDGLLKIYGASGSVTLIFHVNVLVDGKLLLVSSHSADSTGFMHVYLLEKESRDVAPISGFLKRPAKGSSGVFRVAVITMVYNEAFYLPFWCRHYGNQVGFENLYVIDHGSTDGSVDPRVCNRIKIPPDKFDDEIRTAMINTLHNSLLNYFDTVIYTDCDEFLVVRPGQFNSIPDYLEHQSSNTIRCIGINVLPHVPNMPPLDLDAPILCQRPFGYATPWYFKPVISSVPTIWRPGFHNCDMPSKLDLNVWLFHLKFADFNHGLEKLEELREIEWRDGKPAHIPAIDQMVNYLGEMQSACVDQIFDDTELNTVFLEGRDSSLKRIPLEFLTVF